MQLPTLPRAQLSMSRATPAALLYTFSSFSSYRRFFGWIKKEPAVECKRMQMAGCFRGYEALLSLSYSWQLYATKTVDGLSQ